MHNNKTSDGKSKKLYLIVEAVAGGINSFNDFGTNVYDVNLHTTKKEAIDCFTPENREYILEVTINKIETDITDAKPLLREIKLS